MEIQFNSIRHEIQPQMFSLLDIQKKELLAISNIREIRLVNGSVAQRKKVI